MIVLEFLAVWFIAGALTIIAYNAVKHAVAQAARR